MYLYREGLRSENETIDNTIKIIISNRDYSRNYMSFTVFSLSFSSAGKGQFLTRIF